MHYEFKFTLIHASLLVKAKTNAESYARVLSVHKERVSVNTLQWHWSLTINEMWVSMNTCETVRKSLTCAPFQNAYFDLVTITS